MANRKIKLAPQHSRLKDDGGRSAPLAHHLQNRPRKAADAHPAGTQALGQVQPRLSPAAQQQAAGFGLGFGPPPPEAIRGRVDAKANEVSDGLDDLGSLATSSIRSRLANAQSGVAGLVNVARGDVDARLGRLAQDSQALTQVGRVHLAGALGSVAERGDDLGVNDVAATGWEGTPDTSVDIPDGGGLSIPGRQVTPGQAAMGIPGLAGFNLPGAVVLVGPGGLIPTAPGSGGIDHWLEGAQERGAIGPIGLGGAGLGGAQQAGGGPAPAAPPARPPAQPRPGQRVAPPKPARAAGQPLPPADDDDGDDGSVGPDDAVRPGKRRKADPDCDPADQLLPGETTRDWQIRVGAPDDATPGCLDEGEPEKKFTLGLDDPLASCKPACPAPIPPATAGASGLRRPGTSEVKRDIGKGQLFSSVEELCKTLRASAGDFDMPVGGIGAALGLKNAAGEYRGITNQDDQAPWYVKDLDHLITSLVGWLIDNAESIARKVYGDYGCANPAALSAMLLKTLLGLLEKYVASDFSHFKLPLEHTLSYHCPTSILGLPDANAAFLANAIDREELDCLVRSNNMPAAMWEKVLEASRTRVTIGELLALWRRGDIDDAALEKRFRQYGYIEPTDLEEAKKLAYPPPPISEIIRYMVRDVENAQTVKDFGMDDLFAENYKDQLEKWGQAQGVSREFAQYSWRAHWSIPSPTQLFEWWHRFRRNGKYGDQAAVHAIVKKALIQQDILPYWVDKLLDTSYRRLTRVDVRRAFEIGALTEADVEQSYVALGYDDRDAQALTDFAKRQLAIKFRSHHAAKSYAASELSYDEATTELERAGAPRGEIPGILTASLVKRRARLRKQCLAGIKRRFLTGELAGDDAQDAITRMGLDADQAAGEVQSWECLQASRPKTITASQLCTWYTQGIITVDEFMERLEKIGYDSWQAVRIVRSCAHKEDMKRVREAEARAKRDQAAQEKAVAKAKREQKELQAAADKAKKLREQRAKLAEKREDAIVAAAEDWAAKRALSVRVASKDIRATVEHVRRSHKLDIDDAIQAATLAAENFDESTGQTLQGLAEEYAGSIVDAAATANAN